MDRSPDTPSPAPVAIPVRLRLIFPGDELSVRGALKTAMGAFRGMCLGADLHGVVEIVLAEALNNIVEHAYGDHHRGMIELDAKLLPDTLTLCIRDTGKPMPSGRVPDTHPRRLDVRAEDLPEGGFGWAMIRQITDDISYRRTGARNELRLRIPHTAVARPN